MGNNNTMVPIDEVVKGGAVVDAGAGRWLTLLC
jgi:hypothetical protein